MANKDVINRRFILALVLLLVIPVASSALRASYARYCCFGEKCSLLVSEQGAEDREERKARREKRKAERQEKRKQKKKEKKQREKEKEVENTRPISDTRQSSANQAKVSMERSTTSHDKSNGAESMLKSEGSASSRTYSRENSSNHDVKRITSSSTSGYTSAHAYEYTNPTTSTTSPSSRKTSIFESQSFWRYAIGGITIFWILSSGVKRRCGRCHKWWAMVEVGREMVDEKASTVLKENKVRDSAGSVIMTGEERVPATVYTYHIYRRCKHEGCGYQDYLIKTKKIEN